MRLLQLWADEPDRAPLHLDSRVISLEPIRRARRDEQLRDAYNDGTIIGFYLGVAACLLVLAILSGLLVRIMIALVGGLVWLLTGGTA